MLATLLLAAAIPLGVWPADAGAAAAVVEDVELYLVEPDEDYYILAVQALPVPLTKPEPAAVERLAKLAIRLGADAVLLLAGIEETAIPDDLDEPLPEGDRLVTAVFITFDVAAEPPSGPTLTRAVLAHRGAPGASRRVAPVHR